MKKRFLSLLLCTAMAVSLTACGGKSTGENTGTTAWTETTAGESADGKRKDTEGSNIFTFASADVMVNFDVFSTSTQVITKTMALLWGDPLIASNHEGEFYPGLATEWNWSDDNMQCTFKLRDDVYFHDGKKMTAADVKTTYDRFINGEAYSQAWNVLDSIDAVDDTTVVMNFSTPMPMFYAECCNCPILQGEAYTADPDGYLMKPIGTGPFKVKSFAVDEATIFERNDNYWGWTDDNKSNVDEIVFKTIAEEMTRVASLRTGEIDLALNVSYDNKETLEKEGISTLVKDQVLQIYIGASVNGVMADKNLREAVSLCINRQLIVDSIVGIGSPCGPGIEGVVGYDSSQPEYEYDLEKAKELVANSDYNGETIRLLAPTQQNITRISETMQAIMSMMTEAGFKVEVEFLDKSAYNDRRGSGDYDLALSSWSNAGGDSYKLYSDIIVADRFHTGYTNEEINKIYEERVAGQLDVEVRGKASAEINKIMMEEFAPNIFLYRAAAMTGYQSNITGFEIYPDTVYNFSHVNIN